VLKTTVCSALLACSFGATANNWEQNFFSPMQNELPASRGVAVDNLGFVHLQAFNRQRDSEYYYLSHQYTIGAQGQIPWIWGLSQVDRMSDCGVYAASGQRLDCTQTGGPWGDYTRLEMRSRYDSYVIWQTMLPNDVTLLDASIPNENEALFVGRIDGPWGSELGVFRANSYAPPEVLSVAPACPFPGQTLLTTRLRMPDQPGQSIRLVKACWNSFGTTDVIVDDFDTFTQQWNTLAIRPAPFGASVAHATINADGKAFAIIEHDSGLRELLASGLIFDVIVDDWVPLPLIGNGHISALLANEGTVAVVMDSNAPSMTDPHSVMWFNLQGGLWPQYTQYPAMAHIDAKRFALSSEGALLIAGSDITQKVASQHLWQANRRGEFGRVAMLPLAVHETPTDTMYLFAGLNNTAIVARNISAYMQFGEPTLSVRVNQYDLPMSP
jgi:hypothetical protein